MKTKIFIVFVLIAIMTFCSACEEEEIVQLTYPTIDRETVLPDDIAKRSPETDSYPPIMHSDEFDAPIPLPYPINTSGAEDSPFILPDGNTLYFFFTPDVRIPPNEQLMDNVTGIWVSNKQNDIWSKPVRVWLQDAGMLALDGAPFVRDDEIWFASAREGYSGINIYTAQKDNDIWHSWQIVDDRLAKELEVGELHIYEDELYYHFSRAGGKGDYDIWMTKKIGDKWSDAQNIEAINTTELDGFPYISPDGKEMWFTRVYEGSPAIFGSYRVDGIWQEPKLIVSQFAGEPTLDADGNLYFTHHFYEDGVMIEADIYVAYKKN